MRNYPLLIALCVGATACSSDSDPVLPSVPPSEVPLFELPTAGLTDNPVQVISQPVAGATYLWTWSDGLIATGAAPGRTFCCTGQYSLHLERTKGSQIDELMKVITINAAPLSTASLSKLTSRYYGHIKYEPGGKEQDTVFQITSNQPNTVTLFGNTYQYVPASSNAIYWPGHTSAIEPYYHLESRQGLRAGGNLDAEMEGDSIRVFYSAASPFGLIGSHAILARRIQ